MAPPIFPLAFVSCIPGTPECMPHPFKHIQFQCDLKDEKLTSILARIFANVECDSFEHCSISHEFVRLLQAAKRRSDKYYYV